MTLTLECQEKNMVANVPCSFALEIYCQYGNFQVCQKHAVCKHYLVKTFYCIGMFQIALYSRFLRVFSSISSGTLFFSFGQW